MLIFDNQAIQGIYMKDLIGLVVCGGFSSRMGRDKGLLHYHGLSQRYYLYQLLQPFCKKVFISCNVKQAAGILTGYACITDDQKYGTIGPMAAMLSAIEQYPQDAFLVVGCDYPFIRKEDILQLINSRNKYDTAVSFFNEAGNMYEPLLSVYEKNIVASIPENYHRQQYSLQSVLQLANAGKVYPRQMKTIKSIDTYDDYLIAIEQIKRAAAE